MIEDFTTIYTALKETDSFIEFHKEHSEYALAHGFVQLDAQGNVNKPWHIGFYSTVKDDLAIFTSPDFALSYDKAFKDGGTIAPLNFLPSFKSTQEIVEIVQDQLKKTHPVELPFTYLVILQTIAGQPRYNITVITQAFKMLSFQIDPLTGTIIKESAQSVMDLKAKE